MIRARGEVEIKIKFWHRKKDATIITEQFSLLSEASDTPSVSLKNEYFCTINSNKLTDPSHPASGSNHALFGAGRLAKVMQIEIKINSCGMIAQCMEIWLDYTRRDRRQY